jgi:hypothetical protein
MIAKELATVIGMGLSEIEHLGRDVSPETREFLEWWARTYAEGDMQVVLRTVLPGT